MRKIAVLLAVLTLLVVGSAPVLAAPKPPAGKGNDGSKAFVVTGTIADWNTGAGTITIQVVQGNKRVKSYIGTTLTIQTNSATRLLLMQPDSKPTPITWGQLEPGQVVRAQGVVVNQVWTATRVRVWANPEGNGGV